MKIKKQQQQHETNRIKTKKKSDRHTQIQKEILCKYNFSEILRTR